jgi:ABC-2 type transport system permease protein
MIAQTYQPTFMEKLLGRNYKWWYLVKFHLKRNTNYRLDVVAFRLGDFLTITAIVLAWQLQPVNRTHSEWTDIITYFIIGYIVEACTKSYYDSLIAKKIQNGTFVNYLLNPQPFLQQITLTGFGSFVFPNLSSVLTAALLIPFYLPYLQTFQSDLVGLIFFFGLLVVGWLARSMFMVAMSLLAFWTTETSGINFAAKTGSTILAGSVIPFSFLPLHFEWLQFNPFAWCFYHPMQIYLGNYDTTQILLTFAGGIGWCIALWILAKIVFKAGLKKNESVGL